LGAGGVFTRAIIASLNGTVILSFPLRGFGIFTSPSNHRMRLDASIKRGLYSSNTVKEYHYYEIANAKDKNDKSVFVFYSKKPLKEFDISQMINKLAAGNPHVPTDFRREIVVPDDRINPAV